MTSTSIVSCRGVVGISGSLYGLFVVFYDAERWECLSAHWVKLESERLLHLISPFAAHNVRLDRAYASNTFTIVAVEASHGDAYRNAVVAQAAARSNESGSRVARRFVDKYTIFGRLEPRTMASHIGLNPACSVAALVRGGSGGQDRDKTAFADGLSLAHVIHFRTMSECTTFVTRFAPLALTRPCDPAAPGAAREWHDLASSPADGACTLPYYRMLCRVAERMEAAGALLHPTGIARVPTHVLDAVFALRAAPTEGVRALAVLQSGAVNERGVGRYPWLRGWIEAAGAVAYDELGAWYALDVAGRARARMVDHPRRTPVRAVMERPALPWLTLRVARAHASFAATLEALGPSMQMTLRPLTQNGDADGDVGPTPAVAAVRAGTATLHDATVAELRHLAAEMKASVVAEGIEEVLQRPRLLPDSVRAMTDTYPLTSLVIWPRDAVHLIDIASSSSPSYMSDDVLQQHAGVEGQRRVQRDVPPMAGDLCLRFLHVAIAHAHMYTSHALLRVLAALHQIRSNVMGDGAWHSLVITGCPALTALPANATSHGLRELLNVPVRSAPWLAASSAAAMPVATFLGTMVAQGRVARIDAAITLDLLDSPVPLRQSTTAPMALGDALRAPPTKGFVHYVVRTETLQYVARDVLLTLVYLVACCPMVRLGGMRYGEPVPPEMLVTVLCNALRKTSSPATAFGWTTADTAV